jgi:ATP-dependent DNA ligase
MGARAVLRPRLLRIPDSAIEHPSAPACVYAFGLLELQGWGRRELSLEQRRARLKSLRRTVPLVTA